MKNNSSSNLVFFENLDSVAEESATCGRQTEEEKEVKQKEKERGVAHSRHEERLAIRL